MSVVEDMLIRSSAAAAACIRMISTRSMHAWNGDPVGMLLVVTIERKLSCWCVMLMGWTILRNKSYVVDMWCSWVERLKCECALRSWFQVCNGNMLVFGLNNKLWSCIEIFWHFQWNDRWTFWFKSTWNDFLSSQVKYISMWPHERIIRCNVMLHNVVNIAVSVRTCWITCMTQG